MTGSTEPDDGPTSPIADAPLSSRQEFRQSWRFIVVGWVGLCFGKSGFENSYGAFVVPLMVARHWSMSGVSAWAIFEGLGAVVSAPVIGMIMDRVGSRSVLLAAIPLVALAYASVSTVGHQIWMLYLAFFFVGAFGVAGILAYGRAISGAFAINRGMALGLIYSGLAFTSVFGPRLLQGIVDTKGWQAGFLALAAMLLIPLPLIFVWLRGPKVGRINSTVDVVFGYTVRQAVRLPTFWLLGIANIFYGLALGGVMFELLPFLTANGLSRESAAFYVGVFGGLSFLGQLVIGYALDRFNAAYVCSLLTVVAAVSIAVLGLSHAKFPMFTVPVIGFAAGGYVTCYGYLTPRCFGLKAFGAISGLITTMQYLGWATSPYVFSLVKEQVGSFDGSFVVATLSAIAAAILFGLVGKSRYFPRANFSAVAPYGIPA